MVDRKELDKLSEVWPVHGRQFEYKSGKWNCSVANIIQSSTSADEMTVVLRFDLVSDVSAQKPVSGRSLTLTFRKFEFIKDVSTAMQYAQSLHLAILDFLVSKAINYTRRIP
jgi:hypothetical protein